MIWMITWILQAGKTTVGSGAGITMDAVEADGGVVMIKVASA